MVKEITIQLAGLTVLVKHTLPNCEYLYENYLAQGEPDIIASASNDEEFEQAQRVTHTSPEYAESLCIYRQIAEQLPFFNRFLFHGAAITFADKGYIFTAPSGTGKTTHIKQWKKYLGEVGIVNGDKPVIAVEDNGVTVYGTPWAGKENFQRNRSASVAGLCFVQQGKTNSIRKIEPSECLMRLMRQTYLPESEDAAAKTLELLDSFVAKIPLYQLTCDISEDAVRCSFEAMTGYKFDNMKINGGK